MVRVEGHVVMDAGGLDKWAENVRECHIVNHGTPLWARYEGVLNGARGAPNGAEKKMS